MPDARAHVNTKRLADATKYTVSTAVALALLHNRDAGTVLYAAGGLANSLSAKLLKRVIRQPRPTDSKSDSGMPSSHATSLSFLSLAAWHGRFTGAYGLLGFVGVVLAVVGSCARVRVGYHSWGQVAAGWMLGCFNALVWIKYVGAFVQPLEHVMHAFGDTLVLCFLVVSFLFFVSCQLSTGSDYFFY